MDYPVIPDVAPEVLASIRAAGSVQTDVKTVQKLVASDKSAIVGAVIHVAILLVAAFRLKLSGQDVAILGSIVSAGLSYFVGLNIRTRAKIKL